MKVRDPSGQTWRVSRRWVPWRRRLTGVLDSMPDFPVALGDDPISLIIFVILLIVMIPFLILALIAGLELLLLLLILPFVLLGRVLFGRHWTVEARRGFTIWWDAPSGDWQASGIEIHAVADAIRHGCTPTQTVGAPKPDTDPT
ncbi:MAG: hypothetical protein WKF79_08770 [Nocardioides sp.]